MIFSFRHASFAKKIKSTDRDTFRESKELLSLPEPPPSARKDAFKSPEKALVKNMKKDLSEKSDTRFPKDETDAVTGEAPHTAAEDTAAEDVLHARVSKAVIRRLPRYYRYLRELIREGKSRVSSGELSELMNVTASQIRQDLNCFGGFGQQGYGYNVNYLYTKIGELLGVSAGLRAVIIGAGNLGSALVGSAMFEKRGVDILAMFDVDPEVIGTERYGVPVHSMEELESFCRRRHIDIAVLTLPKDQAVSAAERLSLAGVRGLWNFTGMELERQFPSMVTENVHLGDSLMILNYELHAKRATGGKAKGK